MQNIDFRSSSQLFFGYRTVYTLVSILFLKSSSIPSFLSQIILYAESFSTFMFMEIGNIEVCQSVKYFHFPIRRIFISVKFSLNHQSDHHYHSLMYKKAQSDQRCVLQIHSGLYISN